MADRGVSPANNSHHQRAPRGVLWQDAGLDPSLGDGKLSLSGTITTWRGGGGIQAASTRKSQNSRKFEVSALVYSNIYRIVSIRIRDVYMYAILYIYAMLYILIAITFIAR